MRFKASLVAMMLMTVGGTVWGETVGFERQPWNGSITRSGQPLTVPMYNFPAGGTADYQYYEEVDSSVTSVARTGGIANNPKIQQQVFAYSLGQSTQNYKVSNSTGHSRTMKVTSQDSGRKDGSFLLTQSNVVLDGMMMLAKPRDGNYKGLKASFNVQVSWDFDAWGMWEAKGLDIDPISIPVFRGTVNVIGLPNGKPFFYTTGNINRLINVSSIEETNDFFRINFDQEKIPFRVLTRVGYEYTLTTTVTSNITTMGYGTGAEVEFGGDGPALPGMIYEQKVPEPATILSMGLGGLIMFGFRFVHHRPQKAKN